MKTWCDITEIYTIFLFLCVIVLCMSYWLPQFCAAISLIIRHFRVRITGLHVAARPWFRFERVLLSSVKSAVHFLSSDVQLYKRT